MKLALVDDHPMLTGPVKDLLLQQPSIKEVKTYINAAKFLAAAAASLPDILVTDIIMPDTDGLKLLEICQSDFKGRIKVIILSSVTDVQTIRHAIRKGASGFLSKASSIDELTDAISEVAAGGQYIAKNLRESLLNTLFTEDQVVYHLSPREKEVLHQVCSGKTIKEIAYDLNLSIHTVQYYHRNVMNKLKVKRTPDLIVYAMQHGLYKPV